MNRAPISSHHSFDDARWYSFERNSRIPYGTFDDATPEWMTRPAVRWSVIAALVVALVVLCVVRADVSDEQIVATQVRR